MAHVDPCTQGMVPPWWWQEAKGGLHQSLSELLYAVLLPCHIWAGSKAVVVRLAGGGGPGRTLLSPCPLCQPHGSP